MHSCNILTGDHSFLKVSTLHPLRTKFAGLSLWRLVWILGLALFDAEMKVPPCTALTSCHSLNSHANSSHCLSPAVDCIIIPATTVRGKTTCRSGNRAKGRDLYDDVFYLLRTKLKRRLRKQHRYLTVNLTVNLTVTLGRI